MNNTKGRKIINDPVYGLITIPDDLIFSLISHPWFQRLRRIMQLGLTHYVYPSALHTRFQHALGAMHLMTQAVDVLRSKGEEITKEEETGVIAAILLHDIGHGPFSHTLEKSLVENLSHEDLSLLIMDSLNDEFDGQLEMAISIFRNDYPKHFLHQLVSSQLDMDRLDYLSRDSFFTGVSEGVINTDRIIRMLTVCNDELVVEAKGIYSIEKFLIARRLMYWQVYLHKTVMSAEYLLINILKRAKKLAMEGKALFATKALYPFLYNQVSVADILEDKEWLSRFANLDDYDILASIKEWMYDADKVLAYLCRSLIERNLYKVIIQNEPFALSEVERIMKLIQNQFSVNEEDAAFFMIRETVTNNAYNPLHDTIHIMFKDGSLADVSKASDQLNISVLSTPVSKHLLCYPKSLLT